MPMPSLLTSLGPCSSTGTASYTRESLRDPTITSRNLSYKPAKGQQPNHQRNYQPTIRFAARRLWASPTSTRPQRAKPLGTSALPPHADSLLLLLLRVSIAPRVSIQKCSTTNHSPIPALWPIGFFRHFLLNRKNLPLNFTTRGIASL